MAHEWVSASAPGSIMLFGEHAVLRGFPAIACAVNTRLKVSLTPRKDSKIQIVSDLGKMETALHDLTAHKPFTFVLTALQNALQPVASGLDIQIESEFSSTKGLGSSAAVTIATLAALDRLQGKDSPSSDILSRAIRVIRTVQGVGSGTDAAASLTGGIIFFTSTTEQVESLPGLPPISLIYSGSKDPTTHVTARITDWEKRNPKIAAGIFQTIGALTHEARLAFQAQDMARVGELMNIHQGLQDAMGLSHRPFAEIITTLRDIPSVLGCKISGSGLGDCAVALGDPDATVPGYERIPTQISPRGLQVESH